MLNETFWFLYWVGMVGKVGGLFATTAVVGGMITIGVLLAWAENELSPKSAKRWFTGIICAVIFTGVLAFFTPTEKALYGGATQYVAEAAELDDTLYKLKDVLDARIDELVEREVDEAQE